ncbi:MAG: DUF1697 domain-containing protein [Myxococcales bacterium]
MAVFVALLRALNVGGNMLSMEDLAACCVEAGFGAPKTYIRSGNVVFTSKLGEAKVKAALERQLAEHMGKPIGVHVRTADELEQALERNPFRDAAPARVVIMFMDHPVLKKAIGELKIPGREQVETHGREVFIHYVDGIGDSKLKLPFASQGTGRNVNTTGKLLSMARARELTKA